MVKIVGGRKIRTGSYLVYLTNPYLLVFGAVLFTEGVGVPLGTLYPARYKIAKGTGDSSRNWETLVPRFQNLRDDCLACFPFITLRESAYSLQYCITKITVQVRELSFETRIRAAAISATK